MDYRQVPNALTLARLVLTAAFLLALNQYRYGNPAVHFYLPIATVLFILAAATDAMDGYLARKWQVESVFGRIMDPFCDKILIIGAFIYLAGPRFVIPSRADEFLNMVSGVYPWMVVVMLAREMLVTSVRGELEGQGIKFSANLWGKLKMILQSAVIPIVLILVWLDPVREGMYWARTLRNTLVYATVIVTVISGVPYFISAARVMKRPPEKR